MRKKVVTTVVRGAGAGGEVVPLVVRPTGHAQPLLLAALKKF